MDSMQTYKETGTLAPLVNKREYTEDEKIVILHFFTNYDKNVYCATDNLSSQLWAFLVGQYSRSELSMRDRFLQLFDDAKKAFEEEKITENEYISLKDLAEDIRNNNEIKTKYFNNKASDFLKKWGVNYGHNSLKDADRIRFAVEGVSQVFTKIIEAPFPALGDFQEKSTRYMHFGKESIIYSPILEKSEFAQEIKDINEELMDLYEQYVPYVRDVLVGNQVIKKEDFKRESAYNNTLTAKTFDICRYLLPSGIRTCLGASFSTRTCESHISEMLSSSNEEARLVAQSMFEEALKISPGLLSHVGKSNYLVEKRDKVLEVVNDVFYKKDLKNQEIYKGLDNAQRAKLISTDDIDNIIVASIMFEYSRQKGVSYFDCINRAEVMSIDTKRNIMEAELGLRGQFDRFPRSIQHGRIMFEFLTDFGAYRDYQRHRASNQIWQGVSAIHVFDYPELLDLPGMDKFKEDYDKIMTKVSELSRKVIEKYPYETEYVSALGHLVQTTFEMHPGQLAYVCELRTTPQGHHSYRKLFQKVALIMQEKAPLFMKYVRVNEDLEASRIKQEERAAEKREKLGIE